AATRGGREMRAVDVEGTWGDLVAGHPNLARHLERYGLDYCCGGARSISEACRAAGLDPRAVAADLAAAEVSSPLADWAGLDPAALADHIVAVHHRYLWDQLPRLAAVGAHVVAAHGDRHPPLADVVALLADLRAPL